MTPLIFILLLCFAGAAVFFALHSFFLKKSLRTAREQLARIGGSPTCNERLTCGLPDRELELFLAEINCELDRSQKARIDYEQKERELRRQIANVSHDLRTPLTSILGYLELLEDFDVTGEERRDYLNIVRQRSRALQELITTFYDLSRLESGEYRLDPSPVRLTPLLRDVLALFYRDLENAGFQVETRIDDTLPPVAADKAAVRRVFFNLIQNVLNHGSSFVFIEQCFPPSPSPSGRREILTRIANPAPGMTEAETARVFERFFTADEMRTGRNTGLGMTIAQRLIAQMGHQISARLETGPFPADLPFSADFPVFIVEIRWTPLR